MKKIIGSLLLIFALALSFVTPGLAAQEYPDAVLTASEEAALSGEAPGAGEEESSGETEEEPSGNAEDADDGETAEAGDIVSEEALTAALSEPVTDGSYEDTEKAIVAKIITESMSDYEKLYAITKYAADNFSYSSNWTVSALLSSGSGNCIANSQFIVDLCTLVGIRAWNRKAGMDAGASSGHVCAIALIDGEYYIGDAGYSNAKPRSFDVTQVPDGLSVESGVLYQYDGVDVEHLVIPSTAPKATVVKRNTTYTKGGESITQIGKSGELCFNYNGTGASLRSITLPKTVKTVTATAFKGCTNLENIYVDADNPYFTSIDGVLYSKDLTRLVCVPAKKTSIVMPNTVTKQDTDAFYGGKIPVTVSGGAHPFTDVTNQWYADSVAFVYSHSLFKGMTATTFSPNQTMTRGMFLTVLGRFAGSGTWSALESWSGRLGISNAGGVAVRDRTTTDSSSTVLARIGSAGEFVTVLDKVNSGLDGAVWYKVKYGGTTGYVREQSTGSSGKTLLKVYNGAFTDLPAGKYYTGYGQWANICGVMNGVTSTAFRPEQSIRREEICALMYRYLTAYLGKTLPVSGTAFADDADISAYARDAVYAMRAIGVVKGYDGNQFKPRANATRAEVATMFQNLYNYLNG